MAHRKLDEGIGGADPTWYLSRSRKREMVKKPKFSKIFIVVFLTVLIWVWADLAQDETLPLRDFVTVSVARSSDPTLWISFVDPDQSLQTKVTIDNVDLRGPASRVADVERMKNKGSLEGDLFLVPEQEEGMTEAGTHTFSVLNFLKQNNEVSELGLTVENCEPRSLTVRVVQLVETTVPVECVDLSGNPIPGAIVDPARVRAPVPQDVTYTAKVELSQADLDQARVAKIERTPYVELAPGQQRNATTAVKISLPAAEVALEEYPLQGTLGFCFSPILQGKYEVLLDPNRNETILAAIRVRATQAAFDAYRDQQRFHVLLYVLDEDREATDWIERAVKFNLPEQYVRMGEIEANETVTARFKLVPLSEENLESP